MQKKLMKIGNSMALVIDKPILELLKINPQSQLSISTDGTSLIISPSKSLDQKEKLEQAMSESIEKYSSMYQRLANPDK